MIEVIPCHVSWPSTAAYMPAVLERVRGFARDYEPEQDVESLCRNLWMQWAAPGPMVVAVAAVAEGRVVGHLVVEVVRNDNTVLHVRQYQMDQGCALEPARARQVLGWLEEWGKAVGATAWATLVRDERRVRAFRLLGWQRDRIVLRRGFDGR